MSLFGAMNTAVSGLSAQSAAFSNISDNVANSQTVGFKGTDTDFIDYLTTSDATQNQSGSVATLPQYTNEVQGTITQSTDPLALAISGQGMFAVSEQNSTGSSAATTFSSQQYYTRAGDFSLDKNGYLVNGEGEYLDGWVADPTTGAINQSTLAPIQVNESQSAPVPTTSVALSANLPSTGSTGASSQVSVYDTLGNEHMLDMDWSQVGGSANDWTLSFSSPDINGGAAFATANVQFNSDGTLASVSGGSGGVSGGASTAGSAAALAVPVNFGAGSQSMSINLGTIGQSGGVTQYGGASYEQTSLTQNGAAAGNFTGVSISSSGDVVASYDNGTTATIAQVPIATFADANALQRQDGQAFTATQASGAALVQTENSNAAGNLVTGSVESSNVDIATEFSKLIVAQQAYGANAKMITTANQMLQTTIDMKQ